MNFAPPVIDTSYNSSTECIIARYLRISHEDDKKDESNSITNQRALIQSYIGAQGEFQNARVIDYVDDGKSGSHTDREAYQRLMRDVKRGAVHCIIVKDLSRIGRNLIEVDDLLMNYLVIYKTRFIAINNYYDSFKHPLSNLELAIINLANEHYNKDLAHKSITSKHIKMKRGEFLSCYALFGYKKSETEKNKLVIDEEAAGFVRLMYSLAIDGNNLTQIAKILNAQGIPTPSEYKKRQGITREWNTIDPDYSFWCNALVGRLLHDERYTGKGISNMYKVKAPSTKRVLLRPREEWIIIPGAHEAVISDADYKKAHDTLKRTKPIDVPIGHIFYEKVKCPVCNRTMRRSGKYSPHFKCGTKHYTDHYNCPEISISQASIEKAVLESIKAYSAALIEREELKLAAIREKGATKTELEGRIRMEEKTIKLLEESITKNFMALVSGKMNQEAFLSKKETINETVSQKKLELARLREQYGAVTVGKNAIDEKLAEFRLWQAIDILNREIVDLLVDKILIHDEQQIEIVWVDKR